MKPFNLTWRSIDPTTNRRRWYSLSTARDLWGDVTVIHRWGRLGSTGREAMDWPGDRSELKAIIHRTIKVRKRHGYKLLRRKNTAD